MHGDLELEEQVLDVLARWDRRLAIANAAWAELPTAEQQRRGAALDADVAVLDKALWAAASDGRLDGPSDEAASARHLLRALERIAEILR